MGIVSDGAHLHDSPLHDSPLLGPTLKAVRTQVDAMPEDINLDLDRGYDSAKSRALLAELGFTAEPLRCVRRVDRPSAVRWSLPQDRP